MYLHEPVQVFLFLTTVKNTSDSKNILSDLGGLREPGTICNNYIYTYINIYINIYPPAYDATTIAQLPKRDECQNPTENERIQD